MPMIRSTSSDTFAIFAKLSTSDSVSFGLLSTETDTSLFGSRIRIGALFLRALHRGLHPIGHVHQREPLGGALPRRRPLRRPRLAGRLRPRRPRAARRPPRRPGIGSMPRPRKKSRSPSEDVRPAEKRRERSLGMAASVASAAPRTSGSPSSVSIASSAICSCARGASAPRAASRRTSLATSPRLKKVEERTAKADVHQGDENSWRLDSVIRLLTTSPGAPSGRPPRRSTYRRRRRHRRRSAESVPSPSISAPVAGAHQPAKTSARRRRSPTPSTIALGAISMVSPDVCGAAARGAGLSGAAGAGRDGCGQRPSDCGRGRGASTLASARSAGTLALRCVP